MRFRSRLMWIGFIGAVAYAATSAGAQPKGAGKGGAGVELGGLSVKKGLSGQEQLQEALKLLQRMEQSAIAVRKQVGEARNGRDVVKTLCLDDKLGQLNQAVRSAKDHKGKLQAAVATGDAQAATHESNLLTVLGQRGEQLTTEASQCMGEETAFAGGTQVTTTQSSDIPNDEQGQYPTQDVSVTSIPPQCASCTL